MKSLPVVWGGVVAYLPVGCLVSSRELPWGILIELPSGGIRYIVVPEDGGFRFQAPRAESMFVAVEDPEIHIDFAGPKGEEKIGPGAGFRLYFGLKAACVMCREPYTQGFWIVNFTTGGTFPGVDDRLPYFCRWSIAIRTPAGFETICRFDDQIHN
jgi:hypothetical protein